ncbi:MAG: PAS domain-containing sensor histidine kinase [Candidatus Melainabacteria bacterium]|nr:PAS domain-containing sensor histidine kinase [Candidatus Melainabacteria bacterium]
MNLLRFNALADVVAAVRKYQCRTLDIDARQDELCQLLVSAFLLGGEPAVKSARLFFLPCSKVTDSSEKPVLTENEIQHACDRPKKSAVRKGTVMYLESCGDVHEIPAESSQKASSPAQNHNALSGSVEQTQATSDSGAKIVATVRATEESQLVVALEMTVQLAPEVAPYFRVLSTMLAAKLTDNDAFTRDSVDELAELYELALEELSTAQARNGLDLRHQSETSKNIVGSTNETDVISDWCAQERLQFVMDTIPAAIFWKDVNSVFLGCNKNFARIAGFASVDQIIGKTDFDMPWTAEETEFYHFCDRKIMKENKPQFNIIEPLTKYNGEVCWLSTSKMPMHDAEGNVIGILAHFQDITETMRLQSQREDFMASVAHDLKVPVIGAIRALDALLQGYVGPLDRKQTEFIQCLHRSHENLLLMVKNLLQVLRYESGKDQLTFEHFDLVGILNECVKEAGPSMEAKHVHMQMEAPKKLILTADRKAIRTLVTNLVVNAIGSAPEHTQVKVRLQQLDKQAILEVHNGGEPICKEDMEQLFQRLWQGKRFGAGAGLGLYLCRQIAEGHGGTMSCRSSREDGTVMRFSVPTKASNPSSSGRGKEGKRRDIC